MAAESKDILLRFWQDRSGDVDLLADLGDAHLALSNLQTMSFNEFLKFMLRKALNDSYE